MIYFLSTPVRLGFSKTGRVLGALYAWKVCRTPVCVIYNSTAVCDTSILVSHTVILYRPVFCNVDPHAPHSPHATFTVGAYDICCAVLC
jgi:hypothetical protein